MTVAISSRPSAVTDSTDPHERAHAVSRAVALAIRQYCPAGLGHWPGAWELVEAPSVAFLDALHEWERIGAPYPHPESFRRAANAVVHAWREAAERWEAAGWPGAAHLRCEPVNGADPASSRSTARPHTP
jgi:hypothetical protein